MRELRGGRSHQTETRKTARAYRSIERAPVRPWPSCAQGGDDRSRLGPAQILDDREGLPEREGARARVVRLIAPCQTRFCLYAASRLVSASSTARRCGRSQLSNLPAYVHHLPCGIVLRCGVVAHRLMPIEDRDKPSTRSVPHDGLSCAYALGAWWVRVGLVRARLGPSPRIIIVHAWRLWSSQPNIVPHLWQPRRCESATSQSASGRTCHLAGPWDREQTLKAGTDFPRCFAPRGQSGFDRAVGWEAIARLLCVVSSRCCSACLREPFLCTYRSDRAVRA